MAKAGRVRCGEGTESPSSPRRVFDRTGVAREAPAHRRAGSALPGNLEIAPFIHSVLSFALRGERRRIPRIPDCSQVRNLRHLCAEFFDLIIDVSNTHVYNYAIWVTQLLFVFQNLFPPGSRKSLRVLVCPRDRSFANSSNKFAGAIRKQKTLCDWPAPFEQARAISQPVRASPKSEGNCRYRLPGRFR